MNFLCENCRVSASRAISWVPFLLFTFVRAWFFFLFGLLFFSPFCCFWPTCRAPERAFHLLHWPGEWVYLSVCLFVGHSQGPFLILNLCKVVKSSVTDAIKTTIEHQKGHQLAQRQRGTMRRSSEREWEKVRERDRGGRRGLGRWWSKGINAITPGEHVLSR